MPESTLQAETLELQLYLAQLASDPAEARLEDVLPQLQHEDRSIRLLAIRVLEELGDVRAIPGLLAIAEDEDAAAALREFRTPDAFPLLVEGVRNSDASARRAAVIAIRENFPKFAYEPTLPLLSDSDATVRREAALGIAHSPSATGAELLPLLRDSDATVRRAAITAVAARKADPTGLAIAALLHDSDWQVRTEAAVALVSLADKPAVQAALLASLRDEYWQVAKASIGSLANASPTIALQLIPFLTHSESDVRIATANTLGRLGSRDAIEALRAVLDDPDAGVRKAAARALEAFAR